MKIYTYIGIICASITLLLTGIFLTPVGAASGDEPCVPQAAYTETINHPAVTHTVHHEATPSLWWNWSPNDNKGPQDFEPAFPVDARGTWQGPHVNGGPEQGRYGTFNASNEGHGNSSWFHREPGVDANDEVVTDQAAYVETINHPAVTCPKVESSETPSVTVVPTPVVPPTEEETETPVKEDEPTEEPTVTPSSPEEESTPQQETSSTSVSSRCVGNALVTTTTKNGVTMGSKTVNDHPDCKVGKNDTPVEEEGF